MIYFNVSTLTLIEWWFFNNPVSLKQGLGLLLGAIAVGLLE